MLKTIFWAVCVSKLARGVPHNTISIEYTNNAHPRALLSADFGPTWYFGRGIAGLLEVCEAASSEGGATITTYNGHSGGQRGVENSVSYIVTLYPLSFRDLS